MLKTEDVRGRLSGRFRGMLAAVACAAAAVAIAPVSAGQPVPPAPACALWENGEFDRVDGYYSMILSAPGQPTVDLRAADDFYLEPGYVYKIESITATFFANVAIPDAKLELRADCDGSPGEVLATFLNPIITPTGAYQGTTIQQITFEQINHWLKGGQYWVSVVAKNVPGGSLIYWGTTGPAAPTIGGPVKGSVAHLIAPNGGLPDWTPVDVAGCCCTDLAFTVRGKKCKILHDNGGYDLLRPGPIGSPSLKNDPSTHDNVFTADNFVTNPCVTPVRLCYIRAYIASNCPDARIDLYRSTCELPGQNVVTFTPRVIDTGDRVMVNNKLLSVLCLEVELMSPLNLLPGETFWISAYGLGDGSFNRSSYFLRNAKCGQTSCLVKFSPGRVRGPGIGQTNWVKTKPIIGSAEDYDFAFLVAIVDPDRISETGGPHGGAGCGPGDYNRDGVWDLADLLAFLEDWLPGCP
ncbi:MAG: hypothetical protein KF768_04160 [Phycisphaeraceae bacterium]|nr:hypothetical protein [Phycisphaeraceae bacterium]